MPTPDPNPKPKRTPRKPPAPRKNTKVTGERSEANFLAKAANRNFGIAKPWGDSRRYDFILDNGSRLHRVQVKCTESIRMRAYETRATYSSGKGRAVYTKKDIDFIAAHVVPLDIWYIIPVEICTPAPMLRFYPHRQAKKMRLEPYREAWHLLQSEADRKDDRTDHPGKITLQASADETVYPDEPHVATDAFVRPPKNVETGNVKVEREVERENTPVGTAAPGCPAGQSPAVLTPPLSPTPTRLPKSAAPWPIPLLRIFATRKGKQILPDPPQ